jgi:hypothetical protein
MAEEGEVTPSGGIGEIGVSDGVVELAMSSAHRDYSHRSTVDKLGIKTGDVVALVEAGGTIEDELRRQIEERVGELSPEGDVPADVVLIAGDASTDVVALLEEWKRRIRPVGGIWVLTPKRGQPGYVNGTDLIPAGSAAGLVDNKICSVSDTTSGMRFVIRRLDRPR